MFYWMLDLLDGVAIFELLTWEVSMDSAVFVIIGTIIGGLISIIPNWVTHRNRRKDQYLFALVEKKFLVAQEAYKHSFDLKWIIHKKDEVKGEVLDPIREWYNKSCLYLEPKIRGDFSKVIDDNWNYHTLLETYYQARDAGESEEFNRLRAKLNNVFNSIVTLANRIEKYINQYYKPH